MSTLTSGYGVQIGMLAGGPRGFAALGRGPGGYMAAFLSADGLSWRSGISFGPAPASVTGATVTAAGTVLVTGARGAAGSQRPYLALAQPGQPARVVNVAAVPGATVSQLSVNAIAVYRNQRVAVGEADGLQAVWGSSRRFLVTHLLVVLLGQRCRHPLRFRPVRFSFVDVGLVERPARRVGLASGSSTSGLPASGPSTSARRRPASASDPPAAPSGSPSPAASGAGSPSPAASGPGSPSSGASPSAAASVPSGTAVPSAHLRHLRQPGRQRRRRRPAADQRGARPGGLAGDR